MRAGRAAVRAGLAIGPGWLAAPSAHAHAPIEGMEGFWLGLRHPLSEAAPATALLGLSLALAWVGGRAFRPAMAAYVGGLALGLVLAALPGSVLVPLVPPLLLVALVAALHAAGHAPGAPPAALPRLLPAIAAVGGLLLAPGQLPEPGPLADVLVTVGGSVLTLLLTPLVVLGWVDILLESEPPAWLLVAPRVLASWLAALAALLLALAWAP